MSAGRIDTGSPPFAAAPWSRGEMPALSLAGDPERGAGLSFDALEAAVDRRVQVLREQGLRTGQVVACSVEPGIDFYTMQHSLARAGGVLLPLDSALARGERQRLLASVSAEWSWAADHGRLVPTGLPSPPHPNPHLAVLIRTSGITGALRVAMLTADNVLASCQRVIRYLDLGPGDEWLCCLPLQGVGGLAIGYRCALAGAALRLHAGFDASAVAGDLASRRITRLSLVPPRLAGLLHLGVRPPRSLRVALVGGQALHPGLARRAIAAGWPVYVSYGMSETFSMVVAGKLPADAQEMTLGPPLPDVELDAGPCGERPGCLGIRGPMVMAGYGNPQRIGGRGVDAGWLRTRDLACVDGAKRLHMLGRADDLVIIGGVQVLPAAVEARLAGLPGVEDLAVLGVPHPHWGATLAACWCGTMARDDLALWCREHLKGVERPRLLLRYRGLPRLPGGKTDRRWLLSDARAAVQETLVSDTAKTRCPADRASSALGSGYHGKQRPR